MPIQTTSAIVIRHQALGEHDKLITFFTLDAGKIKAVARSARRPGNRLTGSLDLLNHGELVYFDRPHKDLQYVNSFDIYHTFPRLKAGLDGIAHGFYIAELIDQVSPERDADPDVFQALLQTLESLEMDPSCRLWVHAFEIRLLSLIGIAPQLDHCVACHSILTGNAIRVSPSFGGVVCQSCDPRDGVETQGSVRMLREAPAKPFTSARGMGTITISRGSWRLMQQLQRVPWDGIGRFRLTEQNSRELANTLNSMILHHLGKPLKTLDFLETVRVGYP